ncbi:MAG: hypothetical protein POELPBGB_02749 [Bacteroidia bacterium]|nr:hypothetical protein [Bacteroidia bacterium]
MRMEVRSWKSEVRSCVNLCAFAPLPAGRQGLRAIFLFSAFCFLFSVSAFSQGASVSAQLDTNVIKLGGQTKLRLRIEHTKDVIIAFPELKDSVSSHVEIVEVHKADTLHEKETTFYKFEKSYTITSFDTGFWVIPPIRFYMNNDTAQYLETEPVMLEVRGVAIDPLKDVNDIKEPLSLPITWQEILLIAGIIFLVVGLISAFALYWLFFRKKKLKITQLFQPKPLSATEKALGLLDQLRKKKLWENNQVKLYHSELTDIVRNYIDERFGVSSPEQVSDETLAAMRDRVDENTFAKLKQLLQLADMVKFAKAQPISNENELSMNNAVDFVNATKPIEVKEEKK